MSNLVELILLQSRNKCMCSEYKEEKNIERTRNWRGVGTARSRPAYRLIDKISVGSSSCVEQIFLHVYI
jgi:hypothetical protein